MPSNKDLIADIAELAVALELEVSTEGLKNDELVALKSDLIAKQRDAENVTGADEAEAEAEAVTRAAPPPPAAHVVADGKAVTTLKGIRSEGEEITAAMLPGGVETLDDLIERGFIKK